MSGIGVARTFDDDDDVDEELLRELRKSRRHREPTDADRSVFRQWSR